MTMSDRQKFLGQTLFPNERDFHNAGSLSLLMEQYKTFCHYVRKFGCKTTVD